MTTGELDEQIRGGESQDSPPLKLPDWNLRAVYRAMSGTCSQMLTSISRTGSMAQGPEARCGTEVPQEQ
jgi:hypothetical protein